MKHSYFVAFVTLCFAIGAMGCNFIDVDRAKETAQDVLDASTEVRQIEDVEIRPRLDALDTLRREQIIAREDSLDDLRDQADSLHRDVIRPMEESRRTKHEEIEQIEHDVHIEYEQLFNALDNERRTFEKEWQQFEREFQIWEREFHRDRDREVRELEKVRTELHHRLETLHRGGNGEEELWQGIHELEEQLNSKKAGSTEYAALNKKIVAASNEIEALNDKREEEVRELENQVYKMDDEIQQIWWTTEDELLKRRDDYDDQRVELDDRRFALDQRGWDLDDQHQVALSDAREKMETAFRGQEEEWSSVYEQQIRPLEEEIYRLEDELGEFYKQERSLVRELQVVETRVEPMEVSIEDNLMELLRTAINSIDSNSQSESGQ